MTKELLGYILLLLALILCQVVVFNHICLFNVAIPLVFIYFIIKLPLTMSVNSLMLTGFLLGLTIDIFSNTLGINALACTIMSALRNPVLRLYLPRQEDIANSIPSIKTLGLGVFLKYVLTFTLGYCLCYFLIEAFTFFNLGILLLRIIFSTILTSLIIIALASISSSRR